MGDEKLQSKEAANYLIPLVYATSSVSVCQLEHSCLRHCPSHIESYHHSFNSPAIDDFLCLLSFKMIHRFIICSQSLS